MGDRRTVVAFVHRSLKICIALVGVVLGVGIVWTPLGAQTLIVNPG